MSINKKSHSFSQNPEQNDLAYSEKDKNQSDIFDQDQLSSIKFGISKEEFQAFSNGTNLQIFEKKDLKFKAKKLLAYVKTGEINLQIRVRSLVLGLGTFALCAILLFLAINTFGHSQTIPNTLQIEIQQVQTLQHPSQKIVNNDLKTLPLVQQAREVTETKKEQPATVKLTLNEETKVETQKIQKAALSQKQNSEQGRQKKQVLQLKSEQPKVMGPKVEKKQSKCTQENKIKVTHDPKLSDEQQKQKIEEGNNMLRQDMKDNKEKVAPAKIQDKTDKPVEKNLSTPKDKSGPKGVSVEKKKDSKVKMGVKK